MAGLCGINENFPAIQSVGLHVQIQGEAGSGGANSAGAGPVLSATGETMKAIRAVLATFALLIGATTSLQAQDTPPKPPAPAFEAAGTYELQITFGGQAMPIALQLYRDKDVWSGSAGNPNLGTASVTAVKLEGRTLRVDLAADGASFVMTLTVKEDNSVTGKWEGNGDGSPVTGRKTK